ncbi:MAG TPA: sigma-54 dependent transcriptional regulator [Casimicrobiaceae bacterium]|nr:sigma-54 dependent transcriptional regulator [Casimicrobiaceae bacterium]
MPHALIVDDDTNAAAALAELVRDQGFTTACAHSLEAARDLLGSAPDVILLDLMLPDGSGIELLRDATARQLDTQVVVVTGHATLESSIEAMRHGANDYLLKPINFAHLRGVLSRVARPPELSAEVKDLRSELRSLGHYGRLVGGSAPMQRLYDQIGRVAPTGATVLITGESGTGKEIVAQTIHEVSRRRLRPFLAVNCGAISPHIIESELFGHEKGSFTGANRQHRGYFERAHGGTLFLDEITEMPMDLQVKLLRVLETQTVSRVGSDRPIDIDVRMLAATNRNPHDAVANGKLRKDLLYRLQVFPLYVPPLRERSDDIELLANHFLAQLNKKGNVTKALTPAAIDRLKRYHWPGNVRELSNAIHRAFIMTDGEWITQVGLSQEATLAADFSGRSFQIGVGDRIDAVEKRLILATVQHTHTKEAAAEILGISVKTLYNRLRAYETGADLARIGSAAGNQGAVSASGASPPEPNPRPPAT